MAQLSDQEKIEEAHGLWELCVMRLVALVEAGAYRKKLHEAVAEERAAFKHWQAVSRAVLEKGEPK